jgi:CRP/FNR family transcriptional regulator
MTVAQEQMILLGQKSAEERVASFLLMLARRSADTVMPVDIVVPMSRLDMADYLGLTIETVCRVLSKLKRSGLISLKGQRVICLRNIRALEEQAGETDKDPVARIPAHTKLRAVCAH